MKTNKQYGDQNNDSMLEGANHFLLYLDIVAKNSFDDLLYDIDSKTNDKF